MSYVSALKLENNNNNNHKMFYCAGILPYQIKNGEVYILLGKDNTESWSDFGGKSDLCDNNDIKKTASREFFEETLNSVVDKKTIDLMLKNEKKFKFIQSKTNRGIPYYMFILQIPMIEDARNNFLNTRKFLSILKEENDDIFKDKESEWKLFEKKDIRWISLDTILQCLDDNNKENESGWKLKDVFKNTLKNNINELIKLNLVENISTVRT